MSSHFVFVYGTLKKNEPNHKWLQSKENGFSRYVSTGKTIQRYPLVIASKYNIPFLLYSKGIGQNVKGEIYEIDDKMLSYLDVLEDHPTFYTREIDQVKIITHNKDDDILTEKIIECWIYFLKNFKLELLKEKFLVEYQSEGDHGKPYTPANKRIPGYHAKVDVLI